MKFIDSNILVYLADRHDDDKRALEVRAKYKLQFYDALLLATAEANGCDVFLSEDLNPGQIYCGMTAVNPFVG